MSALKFVAGGIVALIGTTIGSSYFIDGTRGVTTTSKAFIIPSFALLVAVGAYARAYDDDSVDVDESSDSETDSEHDQINIA